MPPRIAYWTSSFEPEMEAIASEVAILRRNFPHSVAWGLSHRHWALLSWRRGYCLNPRAHLLFRLATRIVEPAFNLNHIFGSLGDWFYLTGGRKRPVVLTMATHHPPATNLTLTSIDRFVVECPGAIGGLRDLGIGEERIRLIFPPVDLHRFSPGTAPKEPFTALFASSPDAVEWLEARGVPQILDAAMLRPKMRFRLLWRPWGDSAARVREWIGERGLQNVELVVRCVDDMAGEYNQAHVTLAPFSDANQSKAAPNSLVESLACGRPVLMTQGVGLSEFICAGGAGRSCRATGEALAEHLDELSADWEAYSRRARLFAEKWFGVDRFIQAYQRLYSEVLSG